MKTAIKIYNIKKKIKSGKVVLDKEKEIVLIIVIF